MRIKKAMIIFRKDWKEIRRNWQIILPILVVPLIFAVVLPSSLGSVSSSEKNQTGLENILPPDARAEVAGLSSGLVTAYATLLFLFAPFFLIIPLMASSVIAADSFAGEKERKTTEALLATPISDSELFMGKVLVAFVPAMLVTLVSFAFYSGIVDSIFLPHIGHLVLPNLSWLVLIFLLCPVVALAGIGITVIVSSRVKGFREAQQISGIMVLPVLLLLFAQMSGLLFIGPVVLVALTVILAIVDAVIFKIGIKLFRRESVLAKL